DSKIRRFDLRLLVDDLGYFPAYQAVFLYRSDLQERLPAVVAAILKLENRISEGAMIDMNARVEADKEPVSQVAADFLHRDLNLHVQPRIESQLGELGRHTREHIYLVGV